MMKTHKQIANPALFHLSDLIITLRPWCLRTTETNAPTEKEAPTGLRTHLGGFFRGNTMLCGAVC